MPLQQRSEETYERLLDVAMECFARQGYDATGVAELCERAGVSKGAFYYHFPSKQQLFLELIERWLAGLDARLEELRAPAASVPDSLLAMAEALREIFREAGGQVPMFLEFWRTAQRDPEVWAAIMEPYRRYEERFATLIEMGVAEGSLRPCDPRTAARALVSLAVGLLLQGALDPEGAVWGDVGVESVRLLLDGLRGGG